MEKKQTVLQQIIEKLLADSKYLNGENDCKEDKIVGQYIKTIADDLEENYLPLEQKQIEKAHIAGQKFASDNDNLGSSEYFKETYQKKHN